MTHIVLILPNYFFHRIISNEALKQIYHLIIFNHFSLLIIFIGIKNFIKRIQWKKKCLWFTRITPYCFDCFEKIWRHPKNWSRLPRYWILATGLFWAAEFARDFVDATEAKFMFDGPAISTEATLTLCAATLPLDEPFNVSDAVGWPYFQIRNIQFYFLKYEKNICTI